MTYFHVVTIFLISSCLFSLVTCSCKINPKLTVENANAYIEKHKATVNQTYRLKYHAMPPIGWMSEPSAFIFFQGEYHLFYLHNPYDTVPNNLHWSHMKSKDLVRWEHLPVALAPDQIYDRKGTWSGGAIEKDGRLYLMYTGFTGRKQVQCVAVSEDGVHFEKIKQNPVINNKRLPPNAQKEDFRDPKVFKRGNTYYAVIASKTVEETGQVLLYQSDDLIVWQYKSILLGGTKEQGTVWERPDLFELDGKDVLIVSATRMSRSGNDFSNHDSVIVFIGEVDWDQGILTVESMREVNHGMDFYAAQTTSDNQGRRIMTAWMNMWDRNYPTVDLGHGWVGAMTLPSELSIKDGVLLQKPISEIANYYEKVFEQENINKKDRVFPFFDVSEEVLQLDIEVDLKEADFFAIRLRTEESLFDDGQKTLVAYNVSTSELILDRSDSGIPITGQEEKAQLSSRRVVTSLIDDKLKLQIFVDKSSIDVFLKDGTESLTATIYPTAEESSLIYVEVESRAIIEKVTINRINVE